MINNSISIGFLAGGEDDDFVDLGDFFEDSFQLRPNTYSSLISRQFYNSLTTMVKDLDMGRLISKSKDSLFSAP